MKKPSILDKRPFKSISVDIEDNDKRQIVQLMDDIVSRVESKAFQEDQITLKISEMRKKLRSSNPNHDPSKLEVVGLFKT